MYDASIAAVDQLIANRMNQKINNFIKDVTKSKSRVKKYNQFSVKPISENDLVRMAPDISLEHLPEINKQIQLHIQNINTVVSKSIDKVLRQNLHNPNLPPDDELLKKVMIPTDYNALSKAYNLMERLDDLYGSRTLRNILDEIKITHRRNQLNLKASEESRQKAQSKKKMLQHMVSIRPDVSGATIAYPFKSKVKSYTKANSRHVHYNYIPTLHIPDEKQFHRPYYSNEPGGWEIDLAFKICNSNDIWLFCININTRYLVVYSIPDKSSNNIINRMTELIQNYDVRSVRGDGEKGFKSLDGLLQNHGISRFWTSSKFTFHNKIVDSVIKTIRNAIGYRDISAEQLQQIVNYYNHTKHNGIGCTPFEMQNNIDLEYQYIRWCNNKLQKALLLQDLYKMNRYEPGNILLVHVDKSKTSNLFEKRRTYYDRLGEFLEYINGNVRVRLLTPVLIGKKPVSDIVLPIFHTMLLAKNKSSIPDQYIRSHIINLPPQDHQ